MKLRAILISLCATAMAIGGLVLGTTPASATIINSSGYFHIMSLRSHSCIDVDGLVQQWRCLNTFNEEWTVNFDADATEIVSHASGLCLTQENSSANGTPVVQEPCTGAPSQLWRFSNREVSPYGFDFQLINLSFSQCLDLENGNISNGVPMQVWDCAETTNQRWLQL
jgi:hypothetical protein